MGTSAFGVEHGEISKGLGSWASKLTGKTQKVADAAKDVNRTASFKSGDMGPMTRGQDMLHGKARYGNNKPPKIGPMTQAQNAQHGAARYGNASAPVKQKNWMQKNPGKTAAIGAGGAGVAAGGAYAYGKRK